MQKKTPHCVMGLYSGNLITVPRERNGRYLKPNPGRKSRDNSTVIRERQILHAWAPLIEKANNEQQAYFTRLKQLVCNITGT